ncbi:conserved hypothetical protein [Tenacibaculum maritimum]|uniref:SLOG domain-containing protein n=1 Tax=Tenacibaculum maritimum TaxID=107401 RepID=UPI0012E41AAA|nr:hypothetical protein [Tenacibaculum maritimum]CAA0248675.1 conserved hypothetical protein [Tenacibaculum maritimum]
MATKQLKNIFLSASVPLPERDKKYINTADVIAIRDAVISLTTTVLPKHKLIWGGHPSITPLINYVMQKQKKSIQKHVKIYQSLWFKDKFPEDNNKFENIEFVEKKKDIPSSLYLLRKKMLTENKFEAAVFIGGMEGVEDEYKMFKEFHPDAIIIPLASTGAATKLLFDKMKYKNERFLNDYAYSSIFQEFLIDKL